MAVIQPLLQRSISLSGSASGVMRRPLPRPGAAVAVAVTVAVALAAAVAVAVAANVTLEWRPPTRATPA
ncbi:hypothetical protein K1X22_01195 [Mycolicibacterium farcinogenes]|uniref:hypothetical protein n=1 Tax=Mycolicibacterium farcinogenes TaxID=1802 RepID=UPI001C8D9786|nr:hypothetical protein [Mycolicibacterium farcinogenes]QZH60477.1 hypothetical protein K1X22_01195 [Mycolicibacterium farcinogenes]